MATGMQATNGENILEIVLDALYPKYSIAVCVAGLPKSIVAGCIESPCAYKISLDRFA